MSEAAAAPPIPGYSDHPQPRRLRPADERAASKPMGMLLQDPTLRDEAKDYLHTDYEFPLGEDVLVGTSSSKFIVRDEDEKGVPMFSSLDWGDPGIELGFDAFNQRPLERPIRDNPWFHQVNCFAVAAHTLRAFETALGTELTWRHGGPLVIRPHAFRGANAYYDPMWPSLNFGYFDSPFRPETVWTCLSHDIVAHELGHAVLDSFRPLFVYSYETDTHAVHESIGDLLALFSALEHPELVERLYRESDGDMMRPTFASGLAEEFGIGLSGSSTPYLRSAVEGPPYGPDAPIEAHARSTIWTAAMYQILAEIVAELMSRGEGAPDFEDFKRAVVTATDRTRTMLVRALQYAPPTGVTMPVLARLLYVADERLLPDDRDWREIAKRVFNERGLWDESISLDAPGIGQAFQDFATAGPAMKIRTIAEHADALRIPLTLAPRILIPRLTTATPRVDPSGNGAAAGGRTLTERFVQFAYEWTELGKGPDFEPLGITLYGGGTLIMDENFDDVALVTDPAPVVAELQEEDPAIAALGRSADRFRALHDRTIRAQCLRGRGESRESDALFEGAAFRLERVAVGAARVIGWRCNIAEHLTAISRPPAAFSMTARAGLDYSGLSGAFDFRGAARSNGSDPAARRAKLG